ncbi:MAG: 30S ribosomal protein S7 [Rickettsiales bacterium]|nr:30S ribosomal protein S7 [Rickettsiales bacterium]
MARKGSIKKREIIADPLFNNVLVTKFIRYVMKEGKKTVAERIIYTTLNMLKEKGHPDPVQALETAVSNVRPHIEVRPRRIGGTTYQIPMEVDDVRSTSLALRWMITSAKSRSGKSMINKLADEITDALNNRGGAFNMRENKRKMAEANKAFAHFRW